MESITITVKNQKEKEALLTVFKMMNLEVEAEPEPKKEYKKMLFALREYNKDKKIPSLEDLAKEVEAVRTKRYAKNLKFKV